MHVLAIILVICFSMGNGLGNERLSYYNRSMGTFTLDKRYESHLDILLETLLSQNWPKNESACREPILKIIQNAKNSILWATWILDSMQLPVGQLYGSRYHLGNYDQCLVQKVAASSHPLHMQYCLADIILQPRKKNVATDDVDPHSSVTIYVDAHTRLHHYFNEMSWGVCVPLICKSKSIEVFIRALLKQSHLQYFRRPEIITLRCQNAVKWKETTKGFFIIFSAALFSILLVTTSTVYLSVKRSIDHNSLVENIIRCFCLKKNSEEFLQTPKNDIRVLHGMRFISSSVVVLVHVVFWMSNITTGNGLSFEEQIKSYGAIILNCVIVVDTFFVMSGILFMRNVKPNSTIWDLVNSLIKRYFRLIWWLALNTLVMISIIPRVRWGPLGLKFFKQEMDACCKSWWSSLLMIGNYVEVQNMCFTYVWYIFCDFQLSVVASLLFWIHQKQKRLAIRCFVTLVTLSILLPGWVAYSYPNLGILPFRFDLYSILRNSKTISIIISVYMKTHYRANPYFVGIIMGYVIANNNAKQIRNFFTKKRIINGLLILTSLMVIILVVYVNGNDSVRAALVMGLYRPLWALFVCILIGLCEYGSFPIAKEFLSWSAFVPLSKLTYGIYMVHSSTILLNLLSTRNPLHFDGGVMVEKFLGNLVLSTIISAYFLLFVETPLNNLVKMALDKLVRTKVKMPDEVIKRRADENVKTGLTQLDCKYKKI